MLTALHYATAFRAKNLSAEQLFKLFSALDIYRRESRFNYFLQATAAIARAHHLALSDLLIRCARAAKSYDVQELLTQGYQGQELAQQLQKKRLGKITEILDEDRRIK